MATVFYPDTIISPCRSQTEDYPWNLRVLTVKFCFFMKICNFLAFTGGMLAGGLVMMMFAPKKGEEMRKDIKEKLGDLKRHFDNAGCCGKEGCDCKVEEKIVVEE